VRFSIYQESRTGGRRINQDRMGYLYTRDSLLMLLADGMGGHARGEVAAQLALQTIAAIYQRHADKSFPEPGRFLDEAILAAHRDLHRFRAEEGLPEVPRTTVVACLVQKGMALWAHVGDSRLYLIRDGETVHCTTDHSRVHSLVAAGLIKPEEARVHPERNRIYNCLGAHVLPTVEIGGPFALRHGDTLLLCSDGLWSPLAERDVAGAFVGKTIMRAIPDLIDLALAHGGSDADNCTALAMSWADAEALEMEPPGDDPVSTLMVPVGAVASTLQISRGAGIVVEEDLTDDQIDDAVAEIQKAIQRSSKAVEGK
jgi:protein phosphatase